MSKTISNLALSALLLSSILYFFSYPEVDPDLWGHLFFGREILHQGRLPAANLYSYTAPDHPWVNHEWLAEIIFYGLFDLFGSAGLILFKVAVGGAVVWILDRIIRKRVSSRLTRAITAVWAMAILSAGFNVRPQIFTYFLFTVFLYLFHLFEDKREKALYGVPPLMALWVNLHGGFVAGLGAAGLFSIWALARERRRPEARERYRHVFLPLVLSLLALFLNPYGWNLFEFLAKDLLLDRPITEWQPIRLFHFSFPEFKLAALLVLFLSLRRAALGRWQILLALIALAFSLRNERHTPLFAIVAAPLLAEGIEKVGHRIERETRNWILALGVFILSLYPVYLTGRTHLRHGFQLIVNPNEYPTQAAEFLKRNGVRGNLAVPFDWGEYFIWKLYPGVRVSVDGRYTTAYPLEVIEDNFEWMRGGKGWSRLLEKYPTDIAITHRAHPVSALMRKDPEWVYIYSDPVAFIFVRQAVGQAELLKKFAEKRLVPPEAPPHYFPG